MKWLRFVAIGLAVVVALIAIAAGAAHVLADRKANRTITIDVTPVAYVNDDAANALGKYLFDSRGCAECHGNAGEGHVVIDAPNGMFVRAPNLTRVAKTYREVDWVRSIRHGVKPDGKPLLVMPSGDYARMTDGDLAALVSYVRALPAVDGPGGEIRFPLFVKALYAAGAIPDAAEFIDHKLPPAVAVPVAATAEHGAYVANMCTGCHGPALKGGKIPGGPPNWPPAADLTPGGVIATRYDTSEKFVAMMRTGKRPDGSAVSTVMPFASLKMLNDTDLAALHLYLSRSPGRS